MSASQILLAGHGPEDRWLTESPNRTYFEAKYTPRVNRTRKTYEIPFDNQGTTFGTTGICTIPVKGDYLTRLTLRSVFPPIYTIVPGQYVYPTPSSQVNGFIYVDIGLTQVGADGVTLSANTAGSHYFSVGAGVTLSGTGTLDGTFTIASIPTANSFTCLSTSTGTSTVGTASMVGITPSDVVGYFSTSNFNLWLNNLTNKTWSVTNAVFNMTQLTVTTSDPSGFSVGQYVNLIIVSLSINGVYTIIAATDKTFTVISTFGVYAFDANDLVNPVVPPLSITTTPTQFQFSSNIYTSISFETADDAAFWGFDFRSGATYSFPVVTPWTYTQGGWIPGFLPPSLSTWDDSVAHKFINDARVLIGKQTIKEYTGEYIELQNDLTVSYENKAVLKLMNGTLDETQATVAREYYTTLPLGTKEIPLYALTNQPVSVEIDFEPLTNLSQNLNPGTGNFTDSASYLTYDILNGEPVNVQSTLSYQQYIFVLTYDGKLIVYDTTQPINDTASYVVITAFVGSTGLFSQFCILGGVLYIQLLNGYIVKGYVNELIQGNTSSFISNNYLPGDTGNPTGTLIADARYLYYAQNNAVHSNVFFTRYDTQSGFYVSTSYTSFDFTSNIDSSVSTVFQMISTGSQIIALTDTIGKFYVYNLNGNFKTSWNFVDYSSLLINHLTDGVLIGSTLYFIGDDVNLIQYSGGIFSIVYTSGTVIKNLHAVGSKIYASSDVFQVFQFDTLSNLATPLSYLLTDSTAPKIFANGPRFVYMFTQDPSQTTTPIDVIRFDPYPTNPTLQASILIDYESLPPDVPKTDKALIGLVQTQRVTDMNYMNIRGPVKELWITGTSSTTNVFQYSDLSPQSTLAFTNGAEIVTKDVGTRTFLNTIQAFETHTSMPIRNISVVPFEFDPESAIPNGTINLSRMKDQVLSANAATVWARTYNILAIQGGIGGLIFNS